MSAREDLRRLAPKHPPCFYNRMLWVEYLESMSEAGSSASEQRALVVKRNEPARFNFALDWCVDCSVDFRAQMQANARCNPHHLREIAEKMEKLDAPV